MLYLSLFCLNLSYKSLDVYNSGGGVVPNSDVYKYSDPIDKSVGLGTRVCSSSSQKTRSQWIISKIHGKMPQTA